MKYAAFIFLLICCSCKTKPHQDFVIVTTGDEEWTHYEGQWTMDAGVVIMRLALKTGAHGLEAQYKLSESVLKENWASGTSSYSTYSTYFGGGSNNSMGIVLHNLSKFSDNSFFRYSKSSDLPEEMFFITRGQNELLPCDPDFKPLTTDRRYTLHRRSEFLTVEGYVTFEDDSVDFYERNTNKRFTLAEFGEYNLIEIGYKRWAKEKHEGVYVKALAYTITDSTVYGNKALVIKRLVMMNTETEDGYNNAYQLRSEVWGKSK